MHRSGDTDQKEPPDQFTYPSPTAPVSSVNRFSQSLHHPISDISEDAIDPALQHAAGGAEGFQYPRPPLPHQTSSESGSSRSLGMSSVTSGSRGIREGYTSLEGWGTSSSRALQPDNASPPSFSYPSHPFSQRAPSPPRQPSSTTAHFLNSPPHPARFAQSIQTTLPPLPERSYTSSSVTGWSSSSGVALSPISPFSSQLPPLPPISSYDSHPGSSYSGFPPHDRYGSSDLRPTFDPASRPGPSGLGLGPLSDSRSMYAYDMRYAGGPGTNVTGPTGMPSEIGQPTYPMGLDAGFMVVNTEAGPSKRRMSGKNNTPAACAACKKAHLACDPGRPCRRCTSIGKPEGCVDIPHKKRGRPKLAEAKSPTGPKSPPLRRASFASLRMSTSGSAGQSREEGETRPGSYSSSVGRAQPSRFWSVSDLYGAVDPFGSYANSPRSMFTSHFQEEPQATPDIECVVSLNNRLDITAISYVGDHAIVVLDKACIGHPFCDFIHIDDRDIFRNATFCALTTDDRGLASIGGRGRDTSSEEMVTLLSGQGVPRSLAVVRLKDIKESFYRFRLTIRVDPRQPFLNGNNDLIVGLERMSTTAASSMVGTPGVNECYSTRSPSVQSQSNFLNINLSSSSPRATTDTVLPSFAVLSAGVAPPRIWGGPGDSSSQSSSIAQLPGMEGLKITPTALHSDLDSEGSPSSAGRSGFSGISERR